LAESAGTATATAESGTKLSTLAHHVSAAGWSGLEWATGIPGTLGGAIVGNAGAFGRDISDSVISVQVVDADGGRTALPARDVNFTYRSSCFKQERGGVNRKHVVLSAELTLIRREQHEILEACQDFLQTRRAAQPLGQPSAGSIFKNPPNDYAGRLIEEAGLKGLRVGDAQVSTVHANFIVNLGNATAAEVLKLIELLREKVKREFSLELELEIEYIGQHLHRAY
jgi:UDP-N-acetylmuramate dehydrogenase